MIFHGTTDSTVPFGQVEAFRDAMLGAGNPCTLIEFEGRSHGFFNKGRGDGTDYEKTIVDMIEFLNQE